MISRTGPGIAYGAPFVYQSGLDSCYVRSSLLTLLFRSEDVRLHVDPANMKGQIINLLPEVYSVGWHIIVTSVAHSPRP